MREPFMWTRIEVNLSTLAQRRRSFEKLVAGRPKDTTELLAGFLKSILATRDEAALRVVAQYLDSADPVLNRYASYALNNFDPALLARVVPRRRPLRGGVR